MAAAPTIMQFIKGAKAVAEAVDSIGVKATDVLLRTVASRDKDRLIRAEKAAREQSKTQWKKTALTKLQHEEQLVRQEGATYQARAFS